MVILPMRYPRDRVHEGERLVIVAETIGFLDTAGDERPVRQQGEMTPEIVAGELWRTVPAALRGQCIERRSDAMRGWIHGANL